MSTGMDIETVRDQFDLPRLHAFNSYTGKFPPLHVSVSKLAAYFGVWEPSKTAGKSGRPVQNISNKENDAAIAQFITMLG